MLGEEWSFPDFEARGKRGRRAQYNNVDYDSAIRIPKGERRSVIAHEIGHHLEEHSAFLREAQQEFFDARTSGLDVERLRDITGDSGYGRQEVAIEDDFTNPYMGRIYGQRGQQKAFEILTMGLEQMYKDPVAFADEDPQMFDFIYGAIRRRKIGY